MNQLLSWLRTPAAATSATVARLVAGGVLTYSGFLKLMSPAEEFVLAMESYQLLSLPFLMKLARVVPWIEFLVGVYLVLGYAVSVMAFLSSGLFATFIVALLSSLVRGINLADCGCFGRGIHLDPWQMLILDFFFFSCAVLVLLCPFRKFSLDRWLTASDVSRGKELA